MALLSLRVVQNSWVSAAAGVLVSVAVIAALYGLWPADVGRLLPDDHPGAGAGAVGHRLWLADHDWRRRRPRYRSARPGRALALVPARPGQLFHRRAPGLCGRGGGAVSGGALAVRLHAARICESEARMDCLGYNVWLHKYIAFLIAGGVAGIAGILFAYYHGFVSPAELSLVQSAEGLLMVIVGGAGSRGRPSGPAWWYSCAISSAPIRSWPWSWASSMCWSCCARRTALFLRAPGQSAEPALRRTAS